MKSTCDRITRKLPPVPRRIELRRVESDPETGTTRVGRAWVPAYELSWEVYEYEILGAPRGGLRAVAALGGWPEGGVFVPKGLYATPDDDQGPKPDRVYDAISEADAILQDVSRLDPADPAALLAFVNNWGLLGISVSGGPPGKEFLYAPKVRDPSLYQAALVAGWGRGGRGLGRAIALWDGVRETGAWLGWVRDRLETLHGLERGDAPRESWADLAWDLETVLGNITPAPRLLAGRLVPSWRLRRLLDVLALRIYELATGADQLRQCPECGSLFVPDRKDQRYCKTRGRPLCARRVAVRLHRRRKRARRRQGR